jgi:hypothetical protein
MVPTVYEMVNNIYKAFMSDLYDVHNEKDKTRIRQTIHRLSKENGSLSHDFEEVHQEYKKLIDQNFNSKRIRVSLDYLFSFVIKHYQNFIISNYTVYDKEDIMLRFWSNLDERILEMYFQDNYFLKYDENDYFCLNLSIVKDIEKLGDYYFALFKTILLFDNISGNSSFYNIIRIIKKVLSIESDNKLAEEINRDRKILDNWKNKNVLPNSFIEIKDSFNILFKKHNLSERKIDELNYLLYISIAFSRLDIIAKKDTNNNIKYFTNFDDENRTRFRIYIENKNYPITGQIDEMLKYLPQLRKYPGAGVNKMRKERFCDELEKKKSVMDPYKNYYIGYYYYNSERDYEKAKKYFEKVFNEGRYSLGPICIPFVLELMHCCRIENDKKTFNKVYDWNKFIVGKTILDFDTEKKVSKEIVWKKLATLTPILFPTGA